VRDLGNAHWGTPSEASLCADLLSRDKPSFDRHSAINEHVVTRRVRNDLKLDSASAICAETLIRSLWIALDACRAL
jgi:hypothetical protein